MSISAANPAGLPHVSLSMVEPGEQERFRDATEVANYTLLATDMPARSER